VTFTQALTRTALSPGWFAIRFSLLTKEAQGLGISLMDVLVRRSGPRVLSRASSPSPANAVAGDSESIASSVDKVFPPKAWDHWEGLSLEELQCRIGKIWEEVLGVTPIPHNLDYWDLGRGGRRLLRILDRIREESGLDLPLPTVYEAPTIKSFAKWILEGKTATFSTLVLLKAAKSDQPPLFIVTGISGLALELFQTGRAINYAGPIYAIQPRGFGDNERVYDTIDEMVDHYLEVIREVQPHGPYLLSGYSIGGFVAVEMARKLEAAGEPVPFVGLLDSHPFEGYWPFHTWLSFMLRYSARTIRRGVGACLKRENRKPRVRAKGDPSGARHGAQGLDSGRAVGKIGQFLKRFTIRFSDPRSRGYATRFSYYTRGLPAAIQRVTDNGFILVGEFRPSAYDKKMVFFKSELGDEAQCNPLKVWTRYFPHLEVRMTPGDHRSMLHGSNATVLAGEISECIARETHADQPRIDDRQQAASAA
jgi:thioesterase domain-containing protein